MIKLTKINGKEFVLNANLIEYVEANPDTTITMTTGRKIVVQEAMDEVIDLTVQYKRKIYSKLLESKIAEN